jgi:hypothetical protein
MYATWWAITLSGVGLSVLLVAVPYGFDWLQSTTLPMNLLGLAIAMFWLIFGAVLSAWVYDL